MEGRLTAQGCHGQIADGQPRSGISHLASRFLAIVERREGKARAEADAEPCPCSVAEFW